MDGEELQDPRWRRHLLALSSSLAQGTALSQMELLVVVMLALALAVLLILILVLCVCGERTSSAELKMVHTRQTSCNNVQPVAASTPDDVAVEMAAVAQSENGTPGSHNSLVLASSHSRQASSSSANLRPTSLRELPSPPTASPRPLAADHGGGGASSCVSSSGIGDESDDYDHLNQRRRDMGPAANYDHIALPGGSELGASMQTSEQSSGSLAENYYAQVPDRTYDVVMEPSSTAESDHYSLVQDKDATYTEVKEKAEPHTQVKDDGYAKVKDIGYPKVKDDGYAKVKVPFAPSSQCEEGFVKPKHDPYSRIKDDAYAKVSDGSDPYAKVKDMDDPYSKVGEESGGSLAADEEDTYCRVRDDDPYTRVRDEESSADSLRGEGGGSMETEDPYSTVSDEASHTQVKMISVIKIQSSSHSVSERRSITTTTITTNTTTTSSASSRHSHPEVSAAQASTTGASFNPNDDYAVVNKRRTPNPENAQEQESELGGAPPEPPRGYLTNNSAPQIPGGHPPPVPPPLGSGIVDAEQKYNKVTVRESLASMSARNALNPYEVVSEVENMYATVEGGSGDGVVVTQNPPPSPLISQTSETYAEIGATAGLAGGVSAPVPPSVDSLHLITQLHQEERLPRGATSPEETSPQLPDCHPAPSRGSSFSPLATTPPQVSPELPQGEATANGSVGGENSEVTLDPNYHLVKDCVLPDLENEYDPNYESVEEARARGPPAWRRRPHVYEEVPANHVSPLQSPRTSMTAHSAGHVRSRSDEATTMKERLLQSHTYEVITDVKTRHRKSDGGGKR